jgi:predicted permease
VHAALVVLQCAFAVTLLAGAGLMLHSLVRLTAVPSGFDPHGVTTARITLHHSVEGDAARARLLTQSLLQRIAAVPGVHAVGFMGDVLHQRNADIGITVEGAASDVVYRAGTDHVSPDAFTALGAQLTAGRTFTADEDLSSAVIVVNETFARTVLAGRQPIGARVRESLTRLGDDEWLTVVGVVEDMRRHGLESAAVPEFFEPGSPQSFDLIVRTSAGAVTATLADVIRQHDAQLAVTDVATLESRLRDGSAQRRFSTFLLFVFASVALLLAAVGIFGTMHAAVTARRREIGIRGALGATPRSVLALLLTHGMRFAVAGVIAGVVAALWLARTLTSLLFEVRPADPVSLGVAAGILLSVALLACWIPAHRLVAQPLASALHVE